MTKLILFFTLFFSIFSFAACPSPKNCPVGGGGHKVVCTTKSHSFKIEELPFRHEDNSAGCGHTTVNANTLPINVYGQNLNELEKEVTHSFKSCVTIACP